MEECVLRSNGGVIQAAGNGVNRGRLAIFIFQHDAFKAVHDAFFAKLHGGCVVAQLFASSQRLDSGNVNRVV